MTDYTELVNALQHCSHDGLVNCNECKYDGKEWPIGCEEEMMADAADAIEALQASCEQLKPKRGKWEPFDLTWGRSIYSCTVCGEAADVPTANGKALYKYCPNCGAKMEVQE